MMMSLSESEIASLFKHATETIAAQDQQDTLLAERTVRHDDTKIIDALAQNPTEDSVALAFGQKWASKWIYIHGRSTWFQWVGTHWKDDRTGRICEDIRNLARYCNRHGHAIPARRSFVSGVQQFCRTDPIFAREASRFDADNYLLNTPSGTINLLNTEVRRHNRRLSK